MKSNLSMCSSCKKKEPFFYRKYSGERLCKKCFAKSIEDKVRRSITKYQMLNYNDILAVAVSGGKDSISLLKALSTLEKKFPRSSIRVITVDEGIKGYRDEALKITKDICKKFEVENHVVSFKKLYGYSLDEIVQIMRQRHSELTPCAFCGVLRRKALNLAAIDVGANKLATGHTLDDEVQTSLLNLFHGDIGHLAITKPTTDPVHPRLIQKIKPFCEIPEKESALYAFVKKLKFQDTPCPYASEALRNDIRTLINRMEEKHAGTKFTVFRSFEQLRPTFNFFNKNKANFRECTECGEPASEKLCMACKLLKEIE